MDADSIFERFEVAIDSRKWPNVHHFAFHKTLSAFSKFENLMSIGFEYNRSSYHHSCNNGSTSFKRSESLQHVKTTF